MNDLVVSLPPDSMALLESGSRALSQARTLDEVLEIKDQAAAVAYYLKQRGYSFDAQQDAAEIKLRAERRLGELCPRQPVGRGKKISDDGIISIPARERDRFRRIAAVPSQDFERHVGEIRQQGEELTTAGTLRLAKSLNKQAAAPNGSHCSDPCRIEDLAVAADRGLKFGTIYADPPWAYSNQATRASTDNHYETLTTEAICALPIAPLAADCAHLHLWTTNAFLPEAFAVLEAWGFVYKSVFVWVKPQIGIGNYWRVSHEFLLLGVRGQQLFLDKSLRSWLEAERGRHSSKPEQARLMIEKASPGPRLELFARQAAPGWSSWGNEIERDLFIQG